MSDVKIARLVTGEDIMGDFTHTGTGSFVVTNPVILMVMEGQHGPQVGFAPLIPFAEKKEITIDQSKIVFMYDPKAELANGWRTQFSGIITPPKSQLIVG